MRPEELHGARGHASALPGHRVLTARRYGVRHEPRSQAQHEHGGSPGRSPIPRRAEERRSDRPRPRRHPRSQGPEPQRRPSTRHSGGPPANRWTWGEGRARVDGRAAQDPWVNMGTNTDTQNCDADAPRCQLDTAMTGFRNSSSGSMGSGARRSCATNQTRPAPGAGRHGDGPRVRPPRSSLPSRSAAAGAATARVRLRGARHVEPVLAARRLLPQERKERTADANPKGTFR